MFVYSVRASTVKFVGFVLLSFALLFGIVFGGEGSVVSALSDAVTVDYSGIRDNDDRIAFITQFGVRVGEECVAEESFTMPKNFDRVILGYNELQKKQGLDLSKYANKKVTRYTYRAENYNSEGEVFVNLFVHRGKIVACDISSADPDGFVIPLTLVEKSDLKQ